MLNVWLVVYFCTLCRLVTVLGNASARIPMFDFSHLRKSGKVIQNTVVPKALSLQIYIDI